MPLPLMSGDRRSNSRWSELRETGTAQEREESSVRVEGSAAGVVCGLLLAGAARLHGKYNIIIMGLVGRSSRNDDVDNDDENDTD